MKKIIFILSLFLATAQTGFGQCTPGTYNITCTANYNKTEFCAPGNFTVTGNSSFYRCDSDPAGWTFCPSATLQIRLQYWTGSTWSTISSQNISNGGSYSITTSPAETRNYRIQSVVATTGSYCGTGGATVFNSGSTTVAANYPSSSAFRINGQVVNPNTPVKACDNANIDMDNVQWFGYNYGFTYRVGTSKNGGGIVWSAWIAGTPPTVLSPTLKDRLQTNHGLPLTGNYDIHLETRNFCNPLTPHRYTGKLQVIAGSFTSVVVQAKNNNMGAVVNVSASTTCAAPHTSFCYLSTILNASSSSITLVDGKWKCQLDEVPVGNCAATPTLVFAKPLATLTNLADLSSLDLNAYAVTFGSKPIGYVSNNGFFKIWRFTLTLENACVPSPGTSFVCWLRNINTGCKTDGVTDIENEPILESIDKWMVFPNPATNQLNVLWNGNENNNPQLRLFDMSGRLIDIPVRMNGLGQAILDVSPISRGIYTLEYNNGEKQTKQVVVE